MAEDSQAEGSGEVGQEGGEGLEITLAEEEAKVEEQQNPAVEAQQPTQMTTKDLVLALLGGFRERPLNGIMELLGLHIIAEENRTTALLQSRAQTQMYEYTINALEAELARTGAALECVREECNKASKGQIKELQKRKDRITYLEDRVAFAGHLIEPINLTIEPTVRALLGHLHTLLKVPWYVPKDIKDWIDAVSNLVDTTELQKVLDLWNSQ